MRPCTNSAGYPPRQPSAWPEVAMSRSLADGGKVRGFRVRTRDRRGFPPSDSDVEIAKPQSGHGGRRLRPRDHRMLHSKHPIVPYDQSDGDVADARGHSATLPNWQSRCRPHRRPPSVPWADCPRAATSTSLTGERIAVRFRVLTRDRRAFPPSGGDVEIAASQGAGTQLRVDGGRRTVTSPVASAPFPRGKSESTSTVPCRWAVKTASPAPSAT